MHLFLWLINDDRLLQSLPHTKDSSVQKFDRRGSEDSEAQCGRPSGNDKYIKHWPYPLQRSKSNFLQRHQDNMISELRRSKRISDYLPIVVISKNGATGEQLAGPFSGRIIDVSEHGACLLMSQVMQNSFHVFHSTREDDSRLLQLTMNIPPDNINFTITARPVWLNLYRQEQIRAFKMGIEFITNPEGNQMKRLQQAMKTQQKKRSNWWSTHSGQKRA